jgi:hypothetical protein
MFETLKTVLLQTVTVTSAKLGTPADRIGQGLRASATYSTDNLSQGQIPLPHNPAPEQVRVRQLSSPYMRKQMRAGKLAAPPAGSVGCPSAPGFTAVTFVSRSAISQADWQSTTQTAATSRPQVVGLSTASRASFPGSFGRDDRFGSDCQSPSRNSDKQIATRKPDSAVIAPKK